MFNKISSCALLMCALVATDAAPAFAQRTAPIFGSTEEGLVNTINFTLGRFIPRGVDGRSDDDVLLANLGDPQFLLFDVDDFRSVSFGVEYLATVGDFVEVGAGFSYMSKSVPAVYADVIEDDDTEIEQELDLRVVPLAFTARVLPLGRSPIQPYFGGGLGIFPWRYRESGEFVIFLDTCAPSGVGCPIEDREFEASGTAVGPVLLGGLKFASEGFSVGGEIRWQRAIGEFDEDNLDDFFGSEIDLSGVTYQFTVGVRF